VHGTPHEICVNGNEDWEIGIMRRGGFLTLVLCMLPLAGCSMALGSKVRPEPVSFGHPDEIIKGEGFMVLADRREFAVMAFLNATGYDEEAQGQQMHPVRVKVREMVAAHLAEHPDKVKAWQKYRQGIVRKYMETYNYQDYVLSLSTDYPFRRIRPHDELGYWHTASILRDLPEILNDFWATAGLDEVWTQVKEDYVAELKKYDFAKMQRQMAFLWEYLRMERRDNFTVVHVPGLPVDFYMKTLHSPNYWSATPEDKKGPYDLPSHDNMWCMEPERTIEFMKTCAKPWIAYKVLAAGAIQPIDGFKYAFENGADFACVGMCDFQVREDALIANKVLTNLTRPRPWRG
jgi:hypothetical protein